MQTPPKIPETPAGICKRKADAANLSQINCRVIEEMDTVSVERCGVFGGREPVLKTAASYRQKSLFKELVT